MFGGFQKKLQGWQDAGLITPDQAAAITVHEKTRREGKLGRDLTNLGLFAILLGVVSIVASNWQVIPPNGKLGLHTLLNLIVAALIVRTDTITHPFRRDFFVTALAWLSMTFIALIAQVYQLHGELWQTFVFWLAITTPFVLYWGRTYIALGPWIAACILTLFLTFLDYFTFANNWLWLTLIVGIYLPLVLLIASGSEKLAILKPGFIAPLQNLGTGLLGFFATIATFAFIGWDRVTEYHAVLMVLLAIGTLALFFSQRNKAELRWYVIISALLIMAPFALPGIKWGMVGALLFIGYWLYLAWLGAQIYAPRLTDWAIRLIMLRLVILYVETFTGLLTTGFGLILSGILLILLIKYARRIVIWGGNMVRHER